MIEKLLGHEVQYDIPEYHGDNKKCYFGVVSDNFVIDENNMETHGTGWSTIVGCPQLPASLVRQFPVCAELQSAYVVRYRLLFYECRRIAWFR